MVDLTTIRDRAAVIGADGVHVGTVDHIEGDRLKLVKLDTPDQRNHYVPTELISEIDQGNVRLSAIAAIALRFEE